MKTNWLLRLAVLSLLAFSLCFPLRLPAADPFAEGVRSTEPLTPEQQQKTFHLPPGFEIQLVAAEPDLRKPMNMAWDAAGRLWITESREYPWPTNTAPRDTIRIFSDFDPNGRARKVTTFATNLNIPIGLYPFRSPAGGQRSAVSSQQSDDATKSPKADGRKLTADSFTWKCIAWSIPNIWLFEDTDGDGVADRKEILYGPFDFSRDTHGNQASFRRGFDGWLYATHGFNNRSTVKGRDGHEITMNSGNTYRFRIDGSRIEHWTHGQVNPFGLTFDPLGNLYSADCHSSPIYQLLRGAWYPSFGAPHDGLGFAPVTIQHSHGSTAICGITYISDPSWPAEFQDNIFIGNVMTSRINRDQITFTGSSSKGKEMPDFLTTDDPWFRPVDLQFGPDGALYVADFYNRIIGHYEVPLTHPGRDRERGRIWRIVPPVGADVRKLKLISGEPASPPQRDALLNEFLSSNPTRRALAREELALLPNANEHGLITQAAQGLWHFRQGDGREGLMTSCLWLLNRAGQLDEKTLLAVLGDRDEAVRIHALRVLVERGLQAAATSARSGASGPASGVNAALLAAARTALTDAPAFVQRAAADALAANPSTENLAPLLELQRRVPVADTHLAHVTRLALREQLRLPGAFTGLDSKLSEPDLRAIADVAVAITNADAATFLLKHLQSRSESLVDVSRFSQHIARFARGGELDFLAAFARGKFADDLDFQLTLFRSVQEGVAQRGGELSAGARDWGADVAVRLLTPAGSDALAWHNTPLEGATDTRSPWALQERAGADGQRARLMSSFPHGESLAGVLRSAPFPLPAKLSFYLCGHDGFLTQPAQKKNFVRLRLVEERGLQAASPNEKTKARDDSPASSRNALGSGVNAALQGQVIREAAPPRNDTAQKVTWDLGEFAGKRGFIEVTDGDTGTAYAWLAFGRFEPALPQLALAEPMTASRHQQAGAELVGALKLTSLEPRLSELLATPSTELNARAAAAKALLTLKADENLSPLAPLIGDAALPASLRERLCRAVADRDAAAARSTLADAMLTAAHPAQVKLALALAANAPGAATLLRLVTEGKASARLLLEKAIRDKLLAARPTDASARVEQLTKGLTPFAEELQKLIDQRGKAFRPGRASAAKGAEVFAKNCAVCHQIDGKGGLVGPQLDGIGGRGLERIVEDVLDPNRNVDRAFRSHLIALKDGEVVSGLPRREEGELLVLADSTGKEISIPKKNIQDRRESETSLMPSNFGELIAPQDFNDLLAFLLSKAGPTAAK
jgi:putative heme-binding domain-containing protein